MTDTTLKAKPSRLSDNNLRATDFRFHDPERLIEGLNRSQPDPSHGLEVVGYYDETPPGGRKANLNPNYVWCCHCQKPTHWKGLVIRDGRKQLFIIGAQNCGKDHYGVQFDSAESRFKNQLHRKSTLERWDLIAAKAASLRAVVELLLHCEPLRKIERLQHDVKRASATCARLLKMHAKGGAPLLLHNFERDHAAERERQEKYERALRAFKFLTPMVRKERREAGLEPELDETPIHRRWTDDLGQLEGGDFLIDDADVRSAAIGMRKALDEVLATARAGTNDVNTSVLSAHIRAVSDQSSILFQRCTRLNSLELFFARRNVRRLIEWSKGHDRFSIQQDNDAIVIVSQLGDRSVLTMPADAQLPPFDCFSNVELELFSAYGGFRTRRI